MADLKSSRNNNIAIYLTQSEINMLLNMLGKYWSSFFFESLWTEPQKNEAKIPQYATTKLQLHVVQLTFYYNDFWQTLVTH